MDTIIYQTDKVTFFILSQNTISIVRKKGLKGDVDFQKKSHPQMFSHEKSSVEQGIEPRTSHAVVFRAVLSVAPHPHPHSNKAIKIETVTHFYISIWSHFYVTFSEIGSSRTCPDIIWSGKTQFMLLFQPG